MLKLLRNIAFAILGITILWGAWTFAEFNRVKNGNRPLVCFNTKEDIESVTENSKTCYGILYKYREYYLKDTENLSGREFTLFFKDFERKIKD